MTLWQKRILINLFFKSQFNYFPLIWMCCNRSLNNKTNRLHEWCLRIVYRDKKNKILQNLPKEMILSPFTIKISDF